MPRSSRSPRQARLQEILISSRAAAGLTQEDVARRLRRPRSFVSKYETGERRLDVVEFMEVAEAISFDASKLLAELIKVRQPWRQTTASKRRRSTAEASQLSSNQAGHCQ
jgi:transcriptional regulator with XRE-family HTH domain